MNPRSPAIAGEALDSAAVRAKHKEYLFPATANFYEEPIVLAEGKGLRLRDLDGREYLDFFGGILTVSVGHCNDEVNAAVKAQIDRLGHVSTLYPTVPIVELAEKLASIAPGQLKKCFFTASGTEADETAVMMAQVYTGRSEIVALRHGYSGRSMLAQSLTAHAPWRALPSKIADIKHALSPYCYRCPLGLTYPSCEVKCARDIEELIEAEAAGTCGFIALRTPLRIGAAGPDRARGPADSPAPRAPGRGGPSGLTLPGHRFAMSRRRVEVGPTARPPRAGAPAKQAQWMAQNTSRTAD